MFGESLLNYWPREEEPKYVVYTGRLWKATYYEGHVKLEPPHNIIGLGDKVICVAKDKIQKL